MWLSSTCTGWVGVGRVVGHEVVPQFDRAFGPVHYLEDENCYSYPAFLHTIRY